MNVLILGSRDLRQNYNLTRHPKFHLQWFEGDWTTLIDPVQCEEHLENIDWIIHTGVGSIQMRSPTYEDCILPFESIINHCIEASIPLIYISDILAQHVTPANNSLTYLHHLAERETYKLIHEKGKAWIIRPVVMLDEIMGNKELEFQLPKDSVCLLIAQDVLSFAVHLIELQPEKSLFSLTGNPVEVNKIKKHLNIDSSSQLPIRIPFSSKQKSCNLKRYVTPFSEEDSSRDLEFEYAPIENALKQDY